MECMRRHAFQFSHPFVVVEYSSPFFTITEICLFVCRAFIYLFRANTLEKIESAATLAALLRLLTHKCVCLLVCYPFGCWLINCLIVVAVDAAVVVVSMSVNIHHRLSILYLNIMDHMKMMNIHGTRHRVYVL